MKPEELHTLVDVLLAEQRTLTAVEKFGRLHEHHPAPLLEPHYRDLIPLSAPRPGEQYSFEVNLDQCSGCKGCVTACHSLNGLDDGESWREVGALFGEVLVPEARGGNRVVPLRQTVTTACHHCVEPACLIGCPVLAYDKDPATGIVRHLDDQCIGCSYCAMQCPYEVPKYSARRGIVRKCDMCHDRLAVGEAPACVQACPNEAIRITVVERESVRDEYRPGSSQRREALIVNGAAEVTRRTRLVHRALHLVASVAIGFRGRRVENGFLGTPTPACASAEGVRAKSGKFLPDSPDPSLTLPTTRYLSSKSGAPLLAADHFNDSPAPPHWPLVWMLVLTQAGMGGLVAATLSGQGIDAGGLPRLEVVSLALFVGGLAASVFHLGRPAKAWRVWLGWRTSWLSREAIALNSFAAVAAVSLAMQWARPDWPMNAMLRPLVILAGLLAVFAQTMVYADTRRRFWRFASSFPRFLGTAVVVGLALKLHFNPDAATGFALVGMTLGKLANEVAVLKHSDLDIERWTQLRRTAALQSGRLRHALGLRLIFALSGGILMPFALAVGAMSPAWAVLSIALCFSGEIAERYVFFASVAPDRMPGSA